MRGTLRLSGVRAISLSGLVCMCMRFLAIYLRIPASGLGVHMRARGFLCRWVSVYVGMCVRVVWGLCPLSPDFVVPLPRSTDPPIRLSAHRPDPFRRPTDPTGLPAHRQLMSLRCSACVPYPSCTSTARLFGCNSTSTPWPNQRRPYPPSTRS